ncbi:star-related lipid transfer protein 3 [Plakobranchus ocellatus]|uniref:Star-related lipid transfer protein 3 n=1 Tax=Plakobranchus ocellatus TaxID=259542 RepID=A0AAV3XYR0_9GAST|nr:star-related lipid transfer protein 3 [Plakobranchus ocellatus]
MKLLKLLSRQGGISDTVFSTPTLGCAGTFLLRVRARACHSILRLDGCLKTRDHFLDLAQVSLTSAERAEQAKYTGHLIYNSFHGNNNTVPPPVSGVPPPQPGIDSSSIDTRMMEGAGEGAKLSSVRRTFLLYTLFDLGLMFILWVIYTQLIGEQGYKAFKEQVQQYNFKTSLFDCVMLSAYRVTILLLTYGLFRSSKCYMVAFCTAVTCVMLITKIFIFDFDGTRSRNNPLSYCLIIISFVISWSETWFVDFKMIPYEIKMRNKIASRFAPGYGSTFIGAGRSRADDLRSIMTEDNTFYSPLDSPEGSDTEEDGTRRSSSRQHRSPQASCLGPAFGIRQDPLGVEDLLTVDTIKAVEDNDYIKLARHCFEVLWTYLQSPESEWKLEKGTSVEEGLVHSKRVKGIGKIFRLKCYIDMPQQELYDYINTKPEEQSDWNTTVKECRVLQVVDGHTDILYIVSNEQGGGAIQSRDFVTMRNWGQRDGIFLSSGMSVKHPDMPPQKSYIRGQNGMGGYVFAVHPEDPDKTLFYWFMNTDIKGWFPQKLIDANLASVVVNFHHDLAKQVEKLKQDKLHQAAPT